MFVIIDESNRNITANFCTDMVVRAIELTDPEKKNTDDEEDIPADIFFGLPSLTCILNKEMKTVESVSGQVSSSNSVIRSKVDQ